MGNVCACFAAFSYLQHSKSLYLRLKKHPKTLSKTLMDAKVKLQHNLNADVSHLKVAEVPKEHYYSSNHPCSTTTLPILLIWYIFDPIFKKNILNQNELTSYRVRVSLSFTCLVRACIKLDFCSFKYF